ncbi:MAG: asparaginase [Bacteroidia bacterium]|nr:asparaginase [Bacteroidia bacterium]
MPKKKILIIYTGGTLGMGYKIRGDENSPLIPLDWSEIQNSIHIFSHEGYFVKEKGIEFTFHKFNEAIDSSDINPLHWIKILEIIEDNYFNHDGFIIIHGTDTMAYTASFLSFAIQNLTKPIVLTGSQLPVLHSRTDAIQNLSNAIHIAASDLFGIKNIPEVLICFNDKLMRGNRATKSSSRDFSGFETPSFKLLGDLNEPIKINEDLILPIPDGKFETHKKYDTGIIVITLFPGFDYKYFDTIAEDKNIKAIILRTYGNGNAPTDSNFINCLKNLVNCGKLLFNISQCIEGEVLTEKYNTGKKIDECGVISCKNMTLEAAITKLIWLIGNIEINLIKFAFTKNLKGELY